MAKDVKEVAWFGKHVVSLIDFVDQSSMLSHWDFQPNTAEEYARWLAAARKSYGVILQWRELFEKEYSDFIQSLRKTNETESQKPKEAQKLADEYFDVKINHQHFSDTIVFYSPLRNEHGHLHMSHVLAMIVVTGSLLLYALARGVVFRGAIEIGMLAQFPNTKDPYGAGLAKAYHLESKCAEYPRIVLGPEFMFYLNGTMNDSDADAVSTTNRDIARTCRTFITVDTDGRWMVDYLSNACADVQKDMDAYRSNKTRALRFVQSELARFRQSAKQETGAAKEQSEKLVPRYERLEAYFHSKGCC